MALVFLGKNSVPTYTALSSDIATNAIPGATFVGKTVYTTDDGKWFIIKKDLTLAVYKAPSLSVP
jgi:hypothetical protein